MMAQPQRLDSPQTDRTSRMRSTDIATSLWLVDAMHSGLETNHPFACGTLPDERGSAVGTGVARLNRLRVVNLDRAGARPGFRGCRRGTKGLRFRSTLAFS
jgi:hypothetical protein